MKGFVISTCFTLALSTLGKSQFTYFNNYVLPPEALNNNGAICSKVNVQDSVFVTLGMTFFDGNFQRGNYTFSQDGSVQNEQYATQELGYDYIGYSKSISPVDQGFLWGGTYWDYTSNLEFPKVVYYDEGFETTTIFSFETLLNGSASGVVLFAKPTTANTGFFTTGCIYDEVGGDEDPNYDDFIFIRYNQSTEQFYNSSLPVLGSIEFGPPYQYCRTFDGFQLAPNEFLTLGYLAWDRDIMFTKVDSLGNYVEHFTLVNPDLNDWAPWAAPTADGKFMFAYSHCLEYYLGIDGNPDNDVRVGLFDPESMDTLWTKSFGYNGVNYFVTDMEATPDGGFVVLFADFRDYSFGDKLPGEPRAFLLKIDSQGNEEWMHDYHTPIDSRIGEAWDVEVANDGGYVVAGDFFPEDEGYSVTWIFKTDACGELEYNGCPPVSVQEEKHRTGSSVIYPNPASDFIRFHLSPGQDAVRCKVFSANGNLIANSRVRNNMLHVQELPAGLYLVQLFNSNGNVVMRERFVKE